MRIVVNIRMPQMIHRLSNAVMHVLDGIVARSMMNYSLLGPQSGSNDRSISHGVR